MIFPNINEYDDFSVRIRVSDESGYFNPATVNTELNNQNISITLVQRGSLIIEFEISQNEKTIAILYDNNGKFVNSFSFFMNKTTTSPLLDGYYTVIVTGENDFFSNIQNLNDLVAIGLEINHDYIMKKIKIKSGIKQIIKFKKVPYFDESKLYYTNTKETTFISNKASGIVGSYFSLRCHIEFKKEYKSKINNINLLINIPDNCSYLDGSLIID